MFYALFPDTLVAASTSEATEAATNRRSHGSNMTILASRDNAIQTQAECRHVAGLGQLDCLAR
jgi:hypothetical protein